MPATTAGTHQTAAQMQGMRNLPASGKILGVEGGVGCILAWGITKPTDGTAGFAPGCLFIHTDCTNQSDALYCNISTVASCDFNLVTVAA